MQLNWSEIIFFQTGQLFASATSTSDVSLVHDRVRPRARRAETQDLAAHGRKVRFDRLWRLELLKLLTREVKPSSVFRIVLTFSICYYRLSPQSNPIDGIFISFVKVSVDELLCKPTKIKKTLNDEIQNHHLFLELVFYPPKYHLADQIVFLTIGSVKAPRSSCQLSINTNL